MPLGDQTTPKNPYFQERTPAMPRINLTERAVARLKAPDPSGKPVIHWDAKLHGFGVLCSGITNSKSFIAQRELGKTGRDRRVTIARVGGRFARDDGTIREATVENTRDYAEDILAKLKQGMDPKAGRRGALTLQAALDNYLAARKDLRPASVRVYRKVVPLYLKDWLDNPLRNITRDMVEQRHAEVHDEVVARRKIKGPHTGNAAANLAFRVLRMLWNFVAERDATMPTNPVRLRKSWYPEERRTGMVPPEDMPKFYRAVLSLPNAIQRDYIMLLLFTGMRKTEAASLIWDDVDLPRKVLRVRATQTKAGRKLDLPMSDFLHDLFVKRRSLGRDRFVFPANSRSGHIESAGLDAVGRDCGVRVTPHDLRRTFMTAAESCDISVLALKALVNHAAGGDVTAGYVQMSTERLRSAAQKVCDEIKRLCEIEPLPDGVSRLA
jgi:integrase